MIFNRFPLAGRLITFIFLPALTALVLLLMRVADGVPAYEGELTLPVESQATIAFDEYGTATISAESDQDAYFLQGYLHASERMWQMELQRRLVQGRMSEIFGQSSVSGDIFMRILNLHDAAGSALAGLGSEARSALDAYSRGVNSWIEQTKSLPTEFSFFNISPEPWSAIDSIAWQKMFALDLGQNMYAEIARLSALKILSPRDLKTFYPYDPDGLLTMAKSAQNSESTQVDESPISLELAKYKDVRFSNLLEIQNYFQENWAFGQHFTGSNGWVVSGQHTKSGAPLIANDPHLGIQKPSAWYALNIKSKRLTVSGMSMVGVPGVMLGRNPFIAWGATSLMGDQQDLFAIDILPENNSRYMTDSGAKEIFEHHATIDIAPNFPKFLNKEVEPVTVKIRTTELGPIISDAIGQQGKEMVLRWAALDQDDRSFESFFYIQYAKNWGEFRSALSLLKAPSLHFLYGDIEGNIGSHVAGSIPIRGAGSGTLPQSAFHTEKYWKGYAQFDDLSKQFNPKSGFLVSANAKIEQPHNISYDWASPYRQMRISELIDKKVAQGSKLTLSDMKEFQYDQKDLSAAKLLRFLKQKPLQDAILDRSPPKLVDTVEDALQSIEKWDGSYQVESVAASIFHYWFIELKEAVFSNDLEFRSNEYNPSLALLTALDEDRVLQSITTHSERWCDEAVDDIPCLDELSQSFYSAIKRLKKTARTKDVGEWAWGDFQSVELAPKPFGELKFLSTFYKIEMASGGSRNTVNVAGSHSNNSKGPRLILGSAFRHAFDLAHHGENFYLLPSGQSSHIFSPFYKNMLNDFYRKDVSSPEGIAASHFPQYRLDENVTPLSIIAVLPDGTRGQQ